MELLMLWHIIVVPAVVFFMLCLWLCWFYWKLNNSFRMFPSDRFDVKWLLKINTGRLPRDISLPKLVFQEFTSACRRYMKEGVCIVWFVLPYLFCYNEELFKIFFNETSHINKIFVYDFLKELFGTGLLTSSEDIWRKHRKLLNPVFYLSVLKGKMRIFNESAANLVKNLEKVAGEPREDLIHHLQACTFSVMSESILGLKVSDEKQRQKIFWYMETLVKLFECLVYRLARPWLYWSFVLPFHPEGRRYLKLCREVQDFTRDIILLMKENLTTCETSKEDADICREGQKSFAQVLTEEHLKDPTFTIQNIQDEVNTFMIGGYDTTSYAMMWCMYVLGLHPEVQERAYNEILQLTPGENVGYDDLCKLTYVECILKETLRLYPVLPLYARKLNKEIKCGKCVIPKNTNIVFFSYMLHRNPNIYPNPEKFDPDRFTENSGARPWIHTPFSEGYRNCIGKKFAMMEMKVLLVHILRRFSITTLHKIEESDLEYKIFLTPSKPLCMLLNFRKESVIQENVKDAFGKCSL